jgi:hypothetical protein
LQPAAVRAQWTTPDGNGNINNTNTNNVGVGTTTPNYKVDVTNAADKTQFRFGMGAGDSGGFLYSNGASHATFAGGASVNNGWFARSLSASIIEANLGQITFYANSGLSTGSAFTPTARMRITSGGLVGIGTNSPSTKLHVVSGTDTGTTLLSLDTGVHGGTSMSVYGTVNNESGFDMAVYRSGAYTSRFGVNNSGNVYLQPSGGNVGLGTTTPETFARLHIYGSGGFGQDIQTTTNDWTRLRFVAPSRTWGFFLDGQSSGLLGQGSFGLYDYTASAFRMVFNTAGNIGVGTVSPGYKLDVQGGSINSSGGLCIAGECKTAWSQVGGSQWTTSGSTIFYNTGNVGIGLTAAPSRKLEVLGGNVYHQWSTTAGSEYGFYTSINNNHVASNLYFDGAWKMITTGKGAFVGPAPLGGMALNVYGDNTTRSANAVSSPIQLFSVTMSGNVGVGTVSPVFDSNVSKFLTVDGGAGTIGSIGTGGNIPSTSTAVGQFAFVNSNLGTTEKRVATIVGGTDAATNSGIIDFYTASAGSFSAPRIRITSSGNVGIGTSTPTTKLDVNGTVNATGLTVNGVPVGGSQWSTSGTTINYSTGNVGIGTSSPTYSLDVNGGLNAFRTKAATASSNDAIATFENNSAIQMIVRGNGNVGIATTSPTEKLHVTGNVKVTGTVEGGNIIAKYQDMAEWVESSQNLAPGTVVVLDSSKSNQVVAATQSYDSRVAGVISLQPGIVLGERGEGRVLVATTGRVKVKVDATNGPIQIGDLLVTSDREGFAMKSVPVDIGGVRIHRPGTLIGKALEPLAQGTSEILVLLSLQ